MRGQISSNPGRRCGFNKHYQGIILDLHGYVCVAYTPPHVMHRSSYRYYYYYGPLSTGRDGQAMGCRSALDDVSLDKFHLPAINPRRDWWPVFLCPETGGNNDDTN